jgi:hypothetical protein
MPLVAQVDLLVDFEIFESASLVISKLKQHDASEALHWCAENRSRLKKFQVCAALLLHSCRLVD